MKRTEKEVFVKIIKHLSTARLRAIRTVFDDWDHNNRLKKSSWFWTCNGNASERRSKERYYSRDCSLKIGPYILRYWSDVEMSRQNVYWNNGLELSGMEANFTFADIHFLQNYIEELIEHRKSRKTKSDLEQLSVDTYSEESGEPEE